MNNKNKVQNPLTIIAIFAGIAEIAGTAVLLGLPLEIQKTFVWFVMLFPFVLVGLFFIVLLFKHGVLYAPSDFTDESNFIGILKNRSNQINNELNGATSEIEEAKKLIETIEEAKKQLAESTPENTYFAQITELSKKLNLIQSQVENAKQTNNDEDINLKVIHKMNNVINLKKEILSVLKGAGNKGLSPQDIALRTNSNYIFVITMLGSLIDEGLVIKKDNRYFVTLIESA
ncbi:hypothetical protein M3661_19885 [Paenibacillus sp. MER 180]|uniref:hypothetical protein n=1 Tax=Paenibacillus sp. MER 180 TaxID=2939570 RepID=UPI002041948B|nr:hypothetical protein [Paenibacillus sp. MER 180]MCM3292385.1 hypothetical protein [Paenibacillus sp. MER 180]